MDTREAKLADDITNGINTFTFDMEKFVQAMATEHKTLQQKFTGLCLAWIETVGNEHYPIDGRNSHSHYICKDIVKFMKEHDINSHVPTI